MDESLLKNVSISAKKSKIYVSKTQKMFFVGVLTSIANIQFAEVLSHIAFKYNF